MQHSADIRGLLLRALLVPALITVWADLASAGAPVLDEAAVFCTYYSLSGRQPEDRDIEDLYWGAGRPTFSAFKPAEMFSRNGLRAARRDLQQRMESIGPDTVFRWRTKEVVVERSGGGFCFGPGVSRKDLPHATPLIQAEISPAGWKRLQHALKRLSWSSSSRKASGEGGRPGILLEPLQVEDRMERRNIALEDVAIPVRTVVFQPVAVEAPTMKDRITIPISP